MIDRDSIYRSIVAVGGLGFIFLGCVIVLKPFFPALLLALIFCLSTWPTFIWLKQRLGERTTIAATLMTLLLAVGFLVPLIFLGSSLADSFSKVFTTVMTSLRDGPQNGHSWINDIPWIGANLDQLIQSYPAERQQQLIAPITNVLIKTGTSIGHGVIDLSIGVLITFFFFCHGAQAARHLRNVIERFVGERGQYLLNVSKRTMIGVVYGILGTALAQGGLATIGFWIAGIPGAPFLGLLTFLLSFIPFGPPLIWLPAAIWLFSQDQVAMGVFLTLWGVGAISAIDNLVRPYFISLGTNLPFLLVLLGVFGGIIAFGFIGLFIGPTLLAVAYTIILEWSTGRKPPALDESSVPLPDGSSNL